MEKPVAPGVVYTTGINWYFYEAERLEDLKAYLSSIGRTLHEGEAWMGHNGRWTVRYHF